MSDNESDKSSELGSNCSRHWINTRHHRSLYSSKQSLAVIEPVNVYYRTALNYRWYCLSNRSQHFNNDVAGRIVRVARQLEVQLNWQMF